MKGVGSRGLAGFRPGEKLAEFGPEAKAKLQGERRERHVDIRRFAAGGFRGRCYDR